MPESVENIIQLSNQNSGYSRIFIYRSVKTVTTKSTIIWRQSDKIFISVTGN